MDSHDSDSESCESDIELDEGCKETYQCLLCDFESTMVPEFFDHLLSSHAWNLKEEKRLFEDQLVWITFVNWARQTKPSNMTDFFHLSVENQMSFTHPVIENDAVLMVDVETILEGSDDHDEKHSEELRKENEALQLQIAKCREFIKELANRPALEYVHFPQNSHHGYGQAKPLIVSPYHPSTLLLDKFILKDLQNFISKNSDEFIRDKIVLNSFEDGGLLSVFAVKAGARRVFIQQSDSSNLALALAGANGCEDKVEVIPDLQSEPMFRADILLCDWMNSLLHKTGQSKISPLAQSKVGTVIPPIARLYAVGININESLVKSLIPSSTFVDINTSPVVDAAYTKVYHGNWSDALIQEVTDVEEIAKYDIRNTCKLENLQINFSLKSCLTALVNGLMIYVDYETEKRNDTQEFLENNFDHKVWVNKVLQSASNGPNVEAEISSIILNLQRMLETANQEVETIFHEVAQATPRILRDIESVNQQAILLKDHMDSVENDFRKMHIDDNGVIRELERLDRERQRAKKAADALREASRWSMLVNSNQALMEGDANVDQLYQLILDMEQSLVYMEQMPDYASRKALLSSTKDRLETLIAPQFMELLDAITQSKDPRLVESLEHLISIFSALDRSSVAIRYYVTWLTNHMKDYWENSDNLSMDSSPSADQATQRVQHFFDEVIAFLNNQLQLKLFKEDSQNPLLKALILTLESVSPQIGQILFAVAFDSFGKRLSRCGGLFKIVQNVAEQLCCLLNSGDNLKLEICFEAVRKLCAPLAVVSEIFKSYAAENLQGVLLVLKQSYTDENLLLNDLQMTSDRLLKQLDDLLNSAVVETKGIALPSLLDAIHVGIIHSHL
ncbi:hypothetical protein Aperf_G00000105591 [Anoplocephala perfoliata]